MSEQEYLVGLGAQVAAMVVQALKDEGLVHDDRPLLSTREAAARLGIGERTLGELIAPQDGRPPVIASLIVGKGGRKVEPGVLGAYIEEQRRAAWSGRDA